MREWLTVIIVLLIVAVILDGLRRMRQSRRSAIRMSRNVYKEAPASGSELNEYGSELPSGGARVVDVRQPEVARQRMQELRENLDKKKKRVGRGYRIPEQVTLNLDEHVPTLMESIEVDSSAKSKKPASASAPRGNSRPSAQAVARPEARADKSTLESRQEPSSLFDQDDRGFSEKGRIEPRMSFEGDIDLDDDVPVRSSRNNAMDQGVDDLAFSAGAGPQSRATSTGEVEPSLFDDAGAESPSETELEITQSISAEIEGPEPEQLDQEESREAAASIAHDIALPENDYDDYSSDYSNDYSESSSSGYDETDDYEDDAEDDYQEPEVVLVINVMAPKGTRFPGDQLLKVVLGQGMRFGSMNIFHRHEEVTGEGPILYSMANIVVPGTFDLNNMKDFSTPGVSLFMALPLDADSVDAFEKMLGTARALGQHLGGELKDENRSVLTTQTVEHYRSRIREFERKQLSRAPA